VDDYQDYTHSSCCSSKYYVYFFNNKHTHSNYNTTLNTTYNIKLAFFNAILFTDETFALHVLTAL